MSGAMGRCNLHPFARYLVIPTCRPAKLVIKQVMRLQLCKPLRCGHAFYLLKLRATAILGIVVQKWIEGCRQRSRRLTHGHHRRLPLSLAGYPSTNYRIRMRQAHFTKKLDLAIPSGNTPRISPKFNLCMARRMRQRHIHFFSLRFFFAK